MFCLFPEPSLAFSHSPGCMFLTDLPDSPPSSPITPPSDSVDPLATNLNPELTPLCFLVSHNPLLYSLASQRAVAKIRQLETTIGEDPGKHTWLAPWVQILYLSIQMQFTACFHCFSYLGSHF